MPRILSIPITLGLPGSILADESHQISNGCWKIVALEDDGVIEPAAFIGDQNTATDADSCYSPILTTVDAVE
jgi:hypothetical protein